MLDADPAAGDLCPQTSSNSAARRQSVADHQGAPPHSWKALEVNEPTLDFELDLDMDLLVHALMNVLSNAAEATLAAPSGKRLVRLTARARENGALLTVEDSGPGVTPFLHHQGRRHGRRPELGAPGGLEPRRRPCPATSARGHGRRVSADDLTRQFK
jgi:hypothetical protein